ncbi:MAG: rod shape-determining protein MreC [Pseudomonadota bacterium]|nr:rod shape-determining protein MreC [Pseudomonadota bacterium]
METVFKKSFKEFYSFIILVLLSILTIAADYKYNQLDYVRSLLNDTVIYPIDYLSTMPKKILEASVEETQIKEEMENKIKLLENENLKLKIQLQEFQALKDENLRLRKMSEASSKISDKQTLAKVINNKAHPSKKIVSIDKGKKDGVFIGQNVLGLKGLIGQVIETSYLSSKVLLISDLNSNIPSQITRTGEKVIVKGKEKSNELDIPFAPMDMDLKLGDVITTSGMADRFKPNIPIGKISAIDNDKEKKFAKITVAPNENIGNSSELILIWDYKPNTKNE